MLLSDLFSLEASKCDPTCGDQSTTTSTSQSHPTPPSALAGRLISLASHSHPHPSPTNPLFLTMACLPPLHPRLSSPLSFPCPDPPVPCHPPTLTPTHSLRLPPNHVVPSACTVVVYAIALVRSWDSSSAHVSCTSEPRARRWTPHTVPSSSSFPPLTPPPPTLRLSLSPTHLTTLPISSPSSPSSPTHLTTLSPFTPLSASSPIHPPALPPSSPFSPTNSPSHAGAGSLGCVRKRSVWGDERSGAG